MEEYQENHKRLYEQDVSQKDIKFAIECRKVRMFIAQNPGTSDFTIKEKTGIKPSRHLRKMIGMGIIKLEGGLNSFVVIPQ
jgi:hypothetical protein